MGEKNPICLVHLAGLRIFFLANCEVQAIRIHGWYLQFCIIDKQEASGPGQWAGVASGSHWVSSIYSEGIFLLGPL